MKKFHSLFLIVLALCLLFRNSGIKAQDWSDAIYISQGTCPDLVVDPVTGELHIVAVVDGKGVIYTKTDKFGNVLESLTVPNTIKDRGLYYFGPTIAIDSHDYPHIGFREPKSDNIFNIFYTRQTASGWTDPLEIASDVVRGYVVRMAIDNDDFVHFAHGSLYPDWPNNTGPMHYYMLHDGDIQFEQHSVRRIRSDERFELDVSSEGIVDLVSGDYYYAPDNPTIFYWRSPAAGDTLEYVGDIHDLDTDKGPNGSPDLFVDRSGNTHICYGANKDASIGDNVSVRYCRIEAGIKVMDIRVTDSDEIAVGFKVPAGVASVASSHDGQKVVIAYMAGDEGPLYARVSDNGGEFWQEPQYIATGWDSVWAQSRNKQIIRAYRNNFYVVYPTYEGISLKYLDLNPNEFPVVLLSTPDSAYEGMSVNFDASDSYDSDGTIVEYYWDFQNDGVFDDITTEPVDSFTYIDDFSGEVKLKAIDNHGDSSTVTVAIEVANVAPTANAGGTYSGDWYTSININGEADDPGVADTLFYEWDTDEDGIFETAGQDAQTPEYTEGDSHWVVLRVSDDDGGVDIDSAQIVINNQPPVVLDIIDQVIYEGENFTPIQLDAFVDDPDNPDSTISWSFSGTSNLLVSINNDRIATITPIDSLWNGVEVIIFTATDPGGKSDSDFAIFNLGELNNPPEISEISDQTRDENQPFRNINLDDFVSDPNNHDSTLTWTYFDEKYTTVDIVERIAVVAVIDSEWAGSDIIGFVVSNPNGLRDTALVTFTVNAVNDAPVVTSIADQEIFQDQEFTPISLDEYVFDVDDPDSLIRWTATGDFKLEVTLLPGRIIQVNRLDTSWTGYEEITFWAADTSGETDRCKVRFTVKKGIGVADNNSESIPEHFVLFPNYPNPFNPSTSIRYELARSVSVELKIYNQLGHEVRTLIMQNQESGPYNATWNGRDNHGNRVSSGMYIYQLKAGNFVQTRKMVLIY